MSFEIVTSCDLVDCENGARVFSQNCAFLKGVVALDGLPLADRIEVCFAGRSNVGKSSLINALTKRKSLARTSNTPGRTQEINFFTLGDRYYLVDVPGYGYANAPLKNIRKWQNFLKDYLTHRTNLRRVFLLIDSRIGIKANDLEMMALLTKSAVSFQIILTKCDKITQSERETLYQNLIPRLSTFPSAYPQILPTSSKKNIGIECLRAMIAQMQS